MNRIAFVFNHGPHGNDAGREGLDALLSTASLSEDIGVFFISDGVLLLMSYQQPDHILARDFVATFKLLPLYNINQLYLCADSMRERGLNETNNQILHTKYLTAQDWRQSLSHFDIILTF